MANLTYDDRAFGRYEEPLRRRPRLLAGAARGEGSHHYQGYQGGRGADDGAQEGAEVREEDFGRAYRSYQGGRGLY